MEYNEFFQENSNIISNCMIELQGTYNEASMELLLSESNKFNNIIMHSLGESVILENIGETASKIKDVIIKFFKGLIEAVRKAIHTIITKVKDFLKEAKRIFIEKSSEFIKKIKEKKNKVNENAMILNESSDISAEFKTAVKYLYNNNLGDFVIKKDFTFDGERMRVMKNLPGSIKRLYQGSGLYTKLSNLEDLAFRVNENLDKETKEAAKDKFIQDIKEAELEIKSNAIYYLLGGSNKYKDETIREALNDYLFADVKFDLTIKDIQGQGSGSIDSFLNFLNMYIVPEEMSTVPNELESKIRKMCEDTRQTIIKRVAKGYDTSDGPILKEYFGFVEKVVGLSLQAIETYNSIAVRTSKVAQSIYLNVMKKFATT